MKNSIKSGLCLFLAACLAAAMSGCGGASSSPVSSADSVSISSESVSSEPLSWPKEPVTLTYWVGLSSNAAAAISDYNENLMYQEMEKITNIHIDFTHPTTGQENEQFNLMIASRSLPDLIETGWVSYTGGPEKAISDNIILNLNSLLENYAPDALTAMTADSTIEKQCKTDSGNFYAFSPIGDGKDNTQCGPVVRADLLKKLNMTVPETIEDWTNLLTAFKEQLGLSAPITTNSTDTNFWRTWCGVYNVGESYYQDNGTIKYGPMEDGYKEFLTLMHQWYVDGLLDPDFSSNDGSAKNANILNSKSGAFVGFSGGGIATYLTAMKDSDPEFDLQAVQYPQTIDGKDPSFMHRAWEVRTSGQLAITTVNKYPELSALWANYFYTDEGALLKNFGVEDVSYTKDADGNIAYTDLIANNPEGLSVSQALGIYSRGDTPSPGPIIKIPNANERAKESLEIWGTFSDNTNNVLIPPITQLPDEAEEMSTLTTNIDSYQSEMLIKFIMGTESLDKFDEYVSQLKNLKIDRVIELKQAALDRYNAR